MALKANGDYIPGTLTVPTNYPDPVIQNVNAHPIGWAYEPVADQLPGIPQNLTYVNSDWYYPDYDPVTNMNGTEKVRVYLEWDAPANAVSYDVLGNGEVLLTVNSAEAAIPNLPIDTDYDFTVQAHDGYGRVSDLSAVLSLNTND